MMQLMCLSVLFGHHNTFTTMLTTASFFQESEIDDDEYSCLVETSCNLIRAVSALYFENTVFDKSWKRRSAFARAGGLSTLVMCYQSQDSSLRWQALDGTYDCLKPAYKEGPWRIGVLTGIPNARQLLQMIAAKPGESDENQNAAKKVLCYL